MDTTMQIVSAFNLKGNAVSCEPFGHGRINSTYIIATDADKQYVLQLINKNVFKQPDKLMDNAAGVTEYLRKHSDGKYTTLRYMKDKEIGKQADFIVCSADYAQKQVYLRGTAL